MTELMLVMALVAVLATLAVPSLQASKRRNYEGQAIAKLANLGVQEKRYFARFQTFGDFDELQEAGLVPKGYLKQHRFNPRVSVSSVRPYIEMYSVRFTVPQTPNSLYFKIDAVPARDSMGLRTFNINLILDNAGANDSLLSAPPVRESLSFDGPPVLVH